MDSIVKRYGPVAVPSDAQLTGLAYRDFYRILALDVEIRSDMPQLLKLFRGKYANFISPAKERVDCSLYLWGRERLIFADGKVMRAPTFEQMEGHAQVLFTNMIINRITDYFLVHAGVAAKDGQGVIIVAPSSLGKTSLTLSLTKQGLQFLSDEFAPINRRTGLIEPFPRTLGLRRGAAKLFRDIDFAQLTAFKNLGSRSKFLYDVNLLNNASLNPCKFSALVILSPGPEAESGKCHVMDVALYQPEGRVIKALAETGGIELVSVNQETEYPVYRFSVEKSRTPITCFTRICREYQAEILYYERVYHYTPKFEAVPTLEPLDKSQAVMHMLKHLMNFTRNSRLYGEFACRKSSWSWAG